MTQMQDKTKPTHEWRLNNSQAIRDTFPRFKYYDLFVNNKYQSIWIREDSATGVFELAKAGTADYIGPFSSIQEAEDHLIVLDVIDRFERAYG
jgi:hypothetical protein